MKFIGITGGVGAGKSSILSYIRDHYPCEIYLADEVAHEVKKPGTACFQELIRILGEDVLDETGDIDKKRMAEKIFADEQLLERINGIVHPAVKDYLLEKLEAAKRSGKVKLFFVEAALLIECGYGELVDEMWYVHARKSVRRKRLKESRGYSDEKIDQIMKAQLSEEAFRKGSDFVIDNGGELADACSAIDEHLNNMDA
ncbi:MAG: dephospho-CoA kinase [Acetatifactor sp.]|nr:dephospho-CoA kinase [Acetatifactor sp.]